MFAGSYVLLYDKSEALLSADKIVWPLIDKLKLLFSGGREKDGVDCSVCGGRSKKKTKQKLS